MRATQTEIIDFSLGVSCSCKWRAARPSRRRNRALADSRNLALRLQMRRPSVYIMAPATTPASIGAAEKERAIFKSHLLFLSLFSSFLPHPPPPPTAYLLLQPNIDRFSPRASPVPFVFPLVIPQPDRRRLISPQDKRAALRSISPRSRQGPGH